MDGHQSLVRGGIYKYTFDRKMIPSFGSSFLSGQKVDYLLREVDLSFFCASVKSRELTVPSSSMDPI